MSDPHKEDRKNLCVVLPPVRCTPEEKRAIKHRAEQAGLSLSAYIRQTALNGKIHPRASNTDLQALAELRKIGVNLNQQTRRLNATGAIPVGLRSVWSKLEAALDLMMEATRP